MNTIAFLQYLEAHAATRDLAAEVADLLSGQRGRNAARATRAAERVIDLAG
ncbi:MAG TPA: hypothetical protein VGT98_06905 [Candidatus Elarobacter sp.]|nr:hypothetical protein [Candidatus Elarobacter sp.]